MASEQETQEQAGGTAVAEAAETLSVTDNRTGESYELEITDGTVKAMDLRQIKVSEDDFGLMAYDPAFTNTASCRSAITFIDGEAGVLEHRGIPIEQLCEHSTYLEVAYLLIFGELPTKAQLERWVYDITHHTFVHENIKKFVEGFRYDAHPMGMLLASVGALSTFYPDAKQIDDPEERYMATIRMIAKMPTLAAFAYRHNLGPALRLSRQRPLLPGELPLDAVQDDRVAVTSPIRGSRRRSTSSSSSTPTTSRTARPTRCAASAPPRSIPTRRSPRGSRPSTARCTAAPTRRCCEMLRRIETRENIPDFLEGVKNREERLMGFGHRVYKNYDPRARIIKKNVDEVLEATGDNPLLEIATELEKRALDDDYFTERKLYPNVDFYSGLIYEALRIPTEMFTVIFAIPRTAGWVAQWLEMTDDAEQKIARPRQIYTGEREADYVPIDQRDGPEKITGPPARRPARPRRGA